MVAKKSDKKKQATGKSCKKKNKVYDAPKIAHMLSIFLMLERASARSVDNRKAKNTPRITMMKR